MDHDFPELKFSEEDEPTIPPLLEELKKPEGRMRVMHVMRDGTIYDPLRLRAAVLIEYLQLQLAAVDQEINLKIIEDVPGRMNKLRRLSTLAHQAHGPVTVPDVALPFGWNGGGNTLAVECVNLKLPYTR